MAPPTARRFGFSKRAQFGTFLGYVAAFVGLLAGAGVLTAALLGREPFVALRSVAADLTAPVGTTVAVSRSGAHEVGSVMAGYFTSGPEVARLRAEVELARVQLAEARAVQDENRSLRALLGLKEGADRPVAFARLIASTASSTRRFATISAGSQAGIQIGMPVRTPHGLVGRVLEVANSTARVLLVTDPESIVPVQRARDAVPAFAQGRGDGSLQIRLISLGINPLKPGDVLVTSGSGGLYAPGTAVAVVMQLTRDGAIGRVLADPAAIDYAAIYPVYAQAVQMGAALAPAPPPPVPAPKPKSKAKAKGPSATASTGPRPTGSGGAGHTQGPA